MSARPAMSSGEPPPENASPAVLPADSPPEAGAVPDTGELQPDERRRLLDLYAEMATLAGGLAHEIRNPLSTISLNLELLQEDLEDLAESQTHSPEQQRMLRKISLVRRECRNLEGILNAFLQFTRVGQIDLEPADLNEAVRDFITFYEPQANGSGVEIRAHLAINLPPVNLDRTLFRQVLSNLARNAQTAMPKGGLLELQTRIEDETVCLSIIDTGKGMSEETRAKIFQVFFSTSDGGSGLGLPTVKKIIDAHGGRIRCESELGRGTQFTIGLPRATETKIGKETKIETEAKPHTEPKTGIPDEPSRRERSTSEETPS